MADRNEDIATSDTVPGGVALKKPEIYEYVTFGYILCISNTFHHFSYKI